MKKSIVLLTLCTGFILSGSAFAAEKCVALVASSPQAGSRVATSFSATQILDIDLTILFPRGVANKLDGDHLAEIRVFTPSHRLYQSISFPFSADTKKKGQKRRISDYPGLIPVRLLGDVSGVSNSYVGIATSLPVAGTSIMTHSLYGVWTAEAYIDGESLACSQHAGFAITE